MNEIAVIEQLPVITENIKKIGENLDKRLEEMKLDNLVCNEETKKEIKNLRTSLGKELKEFETQRKNIKEKIMLPYDEFNKIYEEQIKVKYQNADTILANKINEVESQIKHEKEVEIKDYFEELKQNANIDFIELVDTGIVVNLSSTIKSLKEQCKNYVDQVSEDLKTIKTQNYSDEIEIEYRKTKDLNKSIQEVIDRHNRLEQLEKIKQSAKETVEMEQKSIEKVNEVLQAPIEENKEVLKQYTVRFKVIGTLKQMQDLKKFLEEGGYKYEQC